MFCLIPILFVSLVASTVPASACTKPRRVDSNTFASIDELVQINKHIGGAGLRGTASSKQNILIEWLNSQLAQIPGVRLQHSSFNLTKWEPQNDSLEEAATLKLSYPDACPARIDVAGAIPYTRLTNGKPVTGQLLYVPQGKNMSAVDAKNKIIIRDVSWDSVPYSILFAISNYRSNDTDSLRSGNYSR